MLLLNFILLTIIFSLAGNAMLKFFYAMVQKDGALDVMFHWQDKLDRWYGKANEGSKFHQWLHDALGGCPMCTAFWFAPVWYTIYALFCFLVMDFFITDYVVSIGAKIFVGWIWFGVFWSCNAIIGLAFLKFKK